MKRSIQYLFSIGFAVLCGTASVGATSTTLVIAQVQAGAASGETAAATQEFVSIYNNSDADVEVTGWCIANKSETPFACVTPEQLNQKLYLTAHSHLTIASDSFSAQYSDYAVDIMYPTTNKPSGSITGGSDTISLRDADGFIVDEISWTSTLSGGYALQRLSEAPDLLTIIDTDSADDFAKSAGVNLPASGLYEIVTIIDMCANLDGIQELVPEGMLLSAEGDCIVDICVNLIDLQVDIPMGYVLSETGMCVYDFAPLRITELLPNVAGSDSGNEYIEIYNPTDRIVDLAKYRLEIGGKIFAFPLDSALQPLQYAAFSNDDIAFTLLNTQGSVAIIGDDETLLDLTGTYLSPKNDMAWALIDDEWQYTNQVTPNAQNESSIIELVIPAAVLALQPCAANQYRNPDTNRCRLLVTVASTPTACKDGQYRSEATNRCRTIALAGGTLTPCREDQYRSELTNRCRSLVTTASTLTPCKDNQYRSEETNRCRTIVASTVPAAAFAVEPIADTPTVFAGWWTIGSIAALAVGYGVWEWRREINAAIRRAASFLTRS